MADSSIAITAGAGTNIDTFTQAGGDHRQAIVVGDATNAYTATVDSTGALLVKESPETDGTAAISIAANATSSGSQTGLNGADTAVIQLTGTFVATVQVQVTADGTNWVNLTGSNSVMNAATGAYLASGNLTAVGIYFANIAGMSGVRVITTAYTSGTVAGTVRVTAGGGAVGLMGQAAVNVAQMNGVAVTMGNGVAGTGVQRVAIASDNTAFPVNATTTPANTTTTGNTLSSAATTNATSLKASAGNLYSVTATNTGAAAAYLKLYNKATAPTVGTDVPVATITIPAGGFVNVPFGSQGFRFATGIGYAITNLAADSDTTAIAAAQVKVMWSYI